MKGRIKTYPTSIIAACAFAKRVLGETTLREGLAFALALAANKRLKSTFGVEQLKGSSYDTRMEWQQARKDIYATLDPDRVLRGKWEQPKPPLTYPPLESDG